MPADDHGVLDWLRRRGAPEPLSRLVREGAGYLRSWRVDPYTQTVTASPILGATDGGLLASPRTRRLEERWPSWLHHLAVLCRPGDGRDAALRLAACLRSEERGLSQPCSSKEVHGNAEANASTQAPCQRGRPPVEASEDRTLEVVLARHFMLLQKSPDSGRRREADAPHLTRFGLRSGTGA
jgi:hypothetical protein